MPSFQTRFGVAASLQVHVLPFPLKAGLGRGQLAAAACESSAQMGAPNVRMRPFRPGFAARQCLLVIPRLFRTTAPVLAQASGISPKATAKSQILAPHLCQGRAPCGHSTQHPIARVKARARARAVQLCATPAGLQYLPRPAFPRHLKRPFPTRFGAASRSRVHALAPAPSFFGAGLARNKCLHFRRGSALQLDCKCMVFPFR